MGTLTDENGNAITDLSASGLTFSETLTQGFDRLVKKFDELIVKIGMVPGKLAAIPATTTVDVIGRYIPPDIPNIEEYGAVPMAGGGDFLVTKPTLFLAGEKGPERASFSGAGNTGATGSTGAMERQLNEQTRLLRDMPRALAIAVSDQMALNRRAA